MPVEVELSVLYIMELLEKPLHYHGDAVRRLFIAAAVIMLVSLPFYYSLVSVPLVLSVTSALVVVFLAGLENPRQRWVIIANTIVSLLGAAVFEYAAVEYMSAVVSWRDPFFWINEVIAVIFVVALYYSSKSMRGILLKNSKVV